MTKTKKVMLATMMKTKSYVSNYDEKKEVLKALNMDRNIFNMIYILIH